MQYKTGLANFVIMHIMLPEVHRQLIQVSVYQRIQSPALEA